LIIGCILLDAGCRCRLLALACALGAPSGSRRRRLGSRSSACRGFVVSVASADTVGGSKRLPGTAAGDETRAKKARLLGAAL